jgi:hypothetical protein
MSPTCRRHFQLSKLMTLSPRPSLSSKRLRSLHLSMVSTSYTITVILDNLLTMPRSNHARPAANDLLYVVSMPISRMELPSAQFRTCWRVPLSSCSMLVLAGRQWCILLCGHMPCAVMPFSTTVCQCWRMGHQGLSYSVQFKLGAIRSMYTLLRAQCLHYKMHWLQASRYLDDLHVLD